MRSRGALRGRQRSFWARNSACTFVREHSYPRMRTRPLLHVRPSSIRAAVQRQPPTHALSVSSIHSGGKKLACPAGVYGRESGLRSSMCSAPCPAGYFCPPAIATPLECGATNVYCPLGSASPIAVPRGFYSLGSSVKTRAAVARCPAGSFCLSGTRSACPAGIYGASEGLSTPACSGACPSGHYCPEQSKAPIPFPAGSYGATTGLQTVQCSGKCREGYYCPPGSISPTEKPCGPNAYCPIGSGEPSRATDGAYVTNGNSGVASRELSCPLGSYCSPHNRSGTAQFCPAGTFGGRNGLSTSACSGKCAVGYYCPPGSTSATQLPCGSVAVYCPVGSALPLPVSPGYYTISSVDDERPGSSTETTRSAQVQCKPGHYCADGRRSPCPPGTFGNSFGLSSSQCSGLCAPGFYCPLASTISTAVPCGSSTVFCPAGSALPTPATTGYCTTGDVESKRSQRSGQRRARPGEFAWKGTCYPCPAGSFGSREGETDLECEGICETGYYCPPGSTSATQFECGQNAMVFCPRGSVAPVDVMDGYYTSVADNGPAATVEALDLGVLAHECVPGRVRADQASAAVAATNRFMDLVTSRSPISVNYRDDLFPVAPCELYPLGTFKRIDTGDDPALCKPCPPLISVSSSDRRTCECYRLPGGTPIDATTFKLHFDRDSRTCLAVPVSDPDTSLITTSSSGNPFDGRITTRSAQFPCEPGFYCQRGVRFPCPAGSYGDSSRETRASCAGTCAPGFYCPLASTNRTTVACGGGTSVFCPAGSKAPKPVWPGYYTIRSASGVVVTYHDDRDMKDAQQQCEPGFFCQRRERFPCPAGRYGNQQGETSPLCTGNCKRGYYCPAGSTSPMEQECGDTGLICRSGSPSPVAVADGYYSIGGSNTTRFHLRECEPGFFSSGGVKYQCSAGNFGATPGLRTSACSGLCAPGYYCPSYPFAPSTSATQLECGDSSVYCPLGTGNTPQLVDSGFFTVGAGDSSGSDDEEQINTRNTTRTAQHICPRGFYCRNGIRMRCPEGTYGDVEGLSAAQYRGWCPTGYYCPSGTSDYRDNPCPVGTYAPRGSPACIACPATHAANRSVLLVGADHLQRPCTHERACCYLG